MPTGIDVALDCTGLGGEIAAAGVEFVGRYYRKKSSSWAALTDGEVQALRGSGLRVVALWESASDHVGYFSHASGVDDGTSAYHQALAAGQTPRTPIYFGVDFDASSEEAVGAVADYFRGIRDGFATIGHGSPAFLIGVYGSGRVCDWLKMHGLVSYQWLAMPHDWSGFDTCLTWNIRQSAGGTAVSFDHDMDEATSDFGDF